MTNNITAAKNTAILFEESEIKFGCMKSTMLHMETKKNRHFWEKNIFFKFPFFLVVPFCTADPSMYLSKISL